MSKNPEIKLETLGNHTHAAKILGISIRILRQKLKAYDSAQAG